MVAHAVGQAQIRGNDIEFPVLLTSDNRKIPHALIPVIGPKHRCAAVYRLPMAAVPAETEVYLFSVRRCLFPEMHE